MGSASSARQIGDEAQQYLFWLWGGRMLAGREIKEVGYETGHFRAFDDVAIRFATPRPDCFTGYFDEEHVQAKFSVAGGKTLTGEALTDPALINATDVSLIERLRDAVDQAARENRHCRFTLWSPWPVDPGSLLDRMVDKCQGALRLDLLFQGKTDRSETGRLRKCWADKLSLHMNDEAELRRILRPLRIDYDPRTLERIRSGLSDIFPIAGLRPISDSNRADCYPLLIQRLHREGRRWFGADDLIEACKHDGLWVGQPTNLVQAKKLGIRTFMRFAEGLEDETDELVCLSEFFTDRHIRDPQFWSAEVLPRILQFLKKNLRAGGRYRLHLPTLGSAAFTAGYLAEPKLGASFEFAQGGINGSKVWACDSGNCDGDVSWSEEVIELNRIGDELAVAISVTHPILIDVKTFAESRLPAVGKVLHFSLPGVGQDAIKNGGHAFRAAKGVIKLIGQRRQVLCLGTQIHLFWSAPNAFAFMLGQLARTLGSITLYEFDFEGAGYGRYATSLSLSPKVRLD
jgi:hypothetical protein